MDFSSIIIGFVTLAIFVGPVIYLHTAKKGREKKLLNEFLDLAKKQQLTITESDLWNNSYCIGLDPKLKQLYFLKKRNDKEESYLLDLTNIKYCLAKKIMRTVQVKKGSYEVIERLELAFIPKDSKREEQTLVFYYGDESLGLTNELPLLEKWEQKVNKLLK